MGEKKEAIPVAGGQVRHADQMSFVGQFFLKQYVVFSRHGIIHATDVSFPVSHGFTELALSPMNAIPQKQGLGNNGTAEEEGGYVKNT
jgi:hypothetical protein